MFKYICILRGRLVWKLSSSAGPQN